MKRFLLFLVIAIAVTSLGLSIYYFSKDNEVIFINNTQISVNAGETFRADSLLTFKNASKYTKVDYNGVQNDKVLTYSKNEGFYAAIAGGETKIVITTSNRSYSNLVINVIVRDGSEEFPYIIDSEDELRLIGNDPNNKFNSDAHYELGRSIILTKKWLPIAEFTGTFNGAGYTISNMDISAYTEEEITATKVDNDGVLEDTDTTAAYNAYNASLAAIEAGDGYAGFIGELTVDDNFSVGKVSNLTLKNVNIKGDFGYVGGIAGRNEGEIRNCHVSTDSYVKLNYVDGKVESETIVYNTIQSTREGVGRPADVAGIVGISGDYVKEVNGIKKVFGAIVERCSSSARLYINGSIQSVGGIVGYSAGSNQITECMFDGYVLSNTPGVGFGGIAGKNMGSSASTIIDNLAIVNTIEETAVTKVGGTVYDYVWANSDADYHFYGNYYSALRTYKANGTYTETDINVVGSVLSDIVLEKIFHNYDMLSATELKDVEKYETYRQIVDGSDYIRTWDFENVWAMGDNYPVLNKNSNTGSIYLIDYSTIKGNNDISSSTAAADFYNMLASGTGSYNVAGDIDMGGAEWLPIDEFSGTLSGTPVDDGNGGKRNPIISNFTIIIPNGTANQGMFNKLANTAVINGLTFSNITIKAGSENTTNSGRYIGVLAGENNGANINNVNVNNVTVENLTLVGFGGLVGYNDYMTGSAVTNVSVRNVTFVNSYAEIAGGITAVNNALIAGTAASGTSSTVYVVADGINVVANQIGGIAGVNYRTIAYAKASLNVTLEKSNAKVYGSKSFIQVGGIAGYNRADGGIASVEGSINLTVDTVKNYTVYAGGIVGYNAGTIYYGHTTNSNITSNYSFSIYAGGIAGISNGVIYGSLVDTTAIKTSTTTIEKNSESYVGGIVGQLAFSSSAKRAGAISNTISKATSLEGFYVGGLVGYSYGSVNKCYVEGTSIKGFYAGGLASIINSVTSNDELLPTYENGFKAGMYKYCYAIASIENVNTNIDMSNLSSADVYNSVASYEKGASAGVAVLVIKGAVVDNCYVNITFVGEGVKASTTISRECGNASAEVHNVANSGIIKNTIFTSRQRSIGTEGGKYVTEDALRPVEGARYKVFEENGFDTSVWTSNIGELPTIFGLDNFVNSHNTAA